MTRRLHCVHFVYTLQSICKVGVFHLLLNSFHAFKLIFNKTYEIISIRDNEIHNSLIIHISKISFINLFTYSPFYRLQSCSLIFHNNHKGIFILLLPIVIVRKLSTTGLYVNSRIICVSFPGESCYS